MNHQRRVLLKTGTAGVIAMGAAGGGLLAPAKLLAAEWNQRAFDAGSMADALQDIGAAAAIDSADLVITAPEIAENGALVQIEVASNIAGTEFIAILVEKNPWPLAASFTFARDAEASISLRLKIAESSSIRVIARADGKTYTAAKEVKVMLGGCGS